MLALFGQTQQALAIPLVPEIPNGYTLANPFNSKTSIEEELAFTNIILSANPLFRTQIKEKLNLSEAWGATQIEKNLNLLRTNGFITNSFHKDKLVAVTLTMPASLPISSNPSFLQRWLGNPFAKIFGDKHIVIYTRKEYESSLVGFSIAKKTALNTNEAFLQATEEIIFKPAIKEAYVKPEIERRVDDFSVTQEGKEWFDEISNQQHISVRAKTRAKIKELNENDEIIVEQQDRSIPPILTVNQLNITKDESVIITTDNLDTIDPDDPSGTGLRRTLFGHGDMIASVAYNTIGDLLASCSWDGSIKIWDSATGDLLHTLIDGENVYSSSFHPTEKQIASAGESKTVKIWDIEKEIVLHVLTGHSDVVTSITYNLSGDRLLSTSYDNTIRVYNSMDSYLLCVLTGHTNYITKALFNPITNEIISGSADDDIKIWSKDGVLLRTISTHSSGVLDLAINPAGNEVASVSNDDSLSIWSLTDGSLLLKTTGQGNDVTSVAFNSRGDQLVIGSTDGSIKILDRNKGALLRTMIAHEDGISSVAFNPTGDEIASGSFYGSTVKVWTAHILASFIFTASNIQNGHFEEISAPGIPVTTFILQAIRNHQIRFIQNGCNLPSSYQISVSNGFMSAQPAAATIQYLGTLPILTQNKITLRQNETITLNTNNFNVTDPCVDPSLIKFKISHLQHGHLPNFTLRDILDLKINVTHDGGCSALSYEIAVANNYSQTSPIAGIVEYSNLPPILTINQLNIDDQETLIVTTKNLNATSLCALPSEIKFTITGLDFRIGRFAQITNPTVPINSFVLKNMLDQQIQFIHNGWCLLPVYYTSASSTTAESIPQPANVTLNKIPRLVRNQLEIGQGETLLLTANNINTTECGQNKDDLIIKITDLVFGYFNNIRSNQSVTLFTQGMINNGTISFTQKNSIQTPHANVTICDGSLCTSPTTLKINQHPQSILLYLVIPTSAGILILSCTGIALACYAKHKKSHSHSLEETPLLGENHRFFKGQTSLPSLLPINSDLPVRLDRRLF